MRILLTGGTGQLGKTILNQFVDYELFAPTRESLDLTSHESVVRVVSTFKPNVIINSAAWTDVPGAELFPEETLRVNSVAVESLAHACSSLGAKFIQLSSDYVFDGINTIPYTEDFKKNPLSTYGLSKSRAEDYLLSEYSENSYIIRTSWLYSKYGKNFVKSILSKLLDNNAELEVVNDQFGSPTLTNDLAFALEYFCRTDVEPGLYNFADSGVASWHSFAQSIAEYSSLNPERIIPAKSKMSENMVSRPAFSVLNTNKYTSVTGIIPPKWYESLSRELPLIRAEVERELSK